MSIEKEVQIYTYTINILNLSLKIKFPCKIHLQFNGAPITTEVSASSPNKFIFNQEVTIKNQTDKEYIEVLVQLVTEKGAKYVGGVLKFMERELIGSQGQRIVVPISKCLDSDASCDVRVEQVSTSRIVKKQSARKRGAQKTEFQPDMLRVGWSGGKGKMNQGETKSQFNMPLSMANKREKYDFKGKQPTVGGYFSKKKGIQTSFDRDPALSAVGGMSAVEFEVYKEGYNKLKDKYRKQAENARTELNKRMALQSNENNMKLEIMRYKLKNQELEKTLAEKNQRIKQFTQSVSNFQKKQLDIKYMKEEIENKNYLIRNLEETIKTLTKDNSQLKNLQSIRNQTQQQNIRALKEQLDKLKKDMENKQGELTRQLRQKNDVITKKEYQLHLKLEELDRAKYVIEDLEKAMSNKMFEWEKIQQSDKATAKTKQDDLKDKIAKLQEEKGNLNHKIREFEEKIQQKRSQIVRIEYDKKVLSQNYDSLYKEVQELKVTREKYMELTREHKILGDEKTHLEKTKERESRLREATIDQLNEKYSQLNENTKKAIRQLQQKLKAGQLRIIQTQGQNELLKNQQEKSKRQNEMLSKQIAELKAQMKELKSDTKQKQERLLALTNQLSDSKNKSKQGDYSSRLELDRQKNQIQRLSKQYEEEQLKANELAETVNRLELEVSKSRMEFQFKEEKFIKQINYAKEKHTNLQNFKADLETQLNAANNTISNLKNSQKTSNEKIQKLQLEAIKDRESIEKCRKDIKVLQEKLQNSENNTKSKAKELSDQLQIRENLDKDIASKDAQIIQLRNELNRQTNEKVRNQKIVQILQGDLSKAKQEHTRLNGVIKNRQKSEEQLRQELKKQKEDYTKLDMKLTALRKQYQKFKDSLVDNLYITFGSIPDGSVSPSMRQSKVASNDRSASRENAQILNMLTNFGKEARSNINKVVDSLKMLQREKEAINSQYSSTVNKCNTNEFEYSQNVNKLEEQISELLAEKQSAENKYEEEIFLLEGRVREKEGVINELTQQIEELDFAYKNIKAELDAVREETTKKDNSKTKLINQLRQQIQYQLSSIAVLENSEEKLYEEINFTTLQLEEATDKINKLEKQLADTKESLSTSEQDCYSLKRQLKKANEKADELSLELITEKQQTEKLRSSVDDEQRKAAELRQFVNGLMKQKQDVIKKELQKSQQLLEHETKIEQLKHENEWLGDEVKKYKKSEEELKESLKKISKALKEEEAANNDEKSKNNKLSEKLKEKERQITIKDESLSRLEEKLKREKDKSSKDLKQIQFQLDETYTKLLNKQKQSNERIITLESQNQRLRSEVDKLKQQIVSSEEVIFTEKSSNEQLSNTLRTTERELAEALEKIKMFEQKVGQLEQQLHTKEEDMYKVQGKVFATESKLQQKQLEKNQKLEDLHADWMSKYEGMMEQYEQRLELVEKEKQFLKDRVDEKERQIKKLSNEIKLQQNNLNIQKKGFEEKIKNVEEDRLNVLSQKNTQNQRLIEESRVNFDSLKNKQSECRRLTSELELAKTTSAKLETRIKESEEKIRSLNRAYQAEVEQLKKKQQGYKKMKQNALSSLWKSERQVRKVVQSTVKKLLEVVDEQSTGKVVEVTKSLQQNVVSAISIKLQQQKR